MGEIRQELRHLDVFDAIYLPGVHRSIIDGAVRLKLVVIAQERLPRLLE